MAGTLVQRGRQPARGSGRVWGGRGHFKIGGRHKEGLFGLWGMECELTALLAQAPLPAVGKANRSSVLCLGLPSAVPPTASK